MSLLVEWVAFRAIGHLIEGTAGRHAQFFTSPQATSAAMIQAPPTIATGHGTRWRVNSKTSGNVAAPVVFHSKSAGCCIRCDRAKRNASHPFTHQDDRGLPKNRQRMAEELNES